METSKEVIPSTVIDLPKKLADVGSDPGVYIMKDRNDVIIYVGKAQNLKKRIASYFAKSRRIDPKTTVMVSKIADFDTIITTNEKEAFILEANLIKRHRPRYNVNLKDDKRYPSLRLNMKETYPNITIVRKIKKDGALYFGPYSSSQAVRQTLKVIHKHFKIRKCGNRKFHNSDRPCLNYQMGTCLGLCHKKVDPDKYHETLQEVILFLKGRTHELIKKLKNDMLKSASEQDYERAATLRDKIYALEKTLENQISVTTDFIDRDIVAVTGTPAYYILTLLIVRGGFLLGSRHFDITETMSNEKEVVDAFIRRYYPKQQFIPKEILVSHSPEEIPLLESELKTLKGQRVKLLYPQRGEKRKIVQMALQNAEKVLEERKSSAMNSRAVLDRLQYRLRLSRFPGRIECFDNSNTQGTDPVSAMVVFVDGRPEKSFYRKYKVKSVSGPDDYATMAEVLRRRYGKNDDAIQWPDLLILDGGKGQLNIAVQIMKDLGIEHKFDVIGIAKRDESKGEPHDKIYKPGRINPVNMGREGDLLLFLQRVRDEAHRFVITFHRKKRASGSMKSALDVVPGIGVKRKRTLLKHFGNIKKIRAASVDMLTELPGITPQIAQSLKKALSTVESTDEAG